MSTPAIRVRGLGKQYRYGMKDGRVYHKTLRSALHGLVGRKTVVENGRDANLFWALKDIDLDIQSGEVLGIIGSNGAGKTTLLRIISGITDPTTGVAEVRGRVGALLEVGTGFHPELTGRENIFVNAAILGMKAREIRRVFDDIVAFSNIGKFLDTPVKFYSSGMQIRLAFSVAAHLQPEILVIDEVLSVGDVAFQKKCLGRMEDVAQSGRTALFVSHNLATVGRLCSRGVLLDKGRVKTIGPIADVISAYLNTTDGSGPKKTFELDTSRSFQFLSLYPANEGKATALLDGNRPLQLCFEVAAWSDQMVWLKVMLFSKEGYEIAGNTFTENDSRNIQFKKNEKRLFMATFPENILNDGHYYFKALAKVKDFDVVEVAESNVFRLVSLSTDDAHADVSKDGFLQVPLTWSYDTE